MFLFLMSRVGLPHLPRKIFSFAAGSAIVFGIASLAGVLDPAALVETVARHEAGVSVGGKFYETPFSKLLLSLIGINIFVWIIAAVAGLYSLYEIIRNRRWFDLLVFGPLAILLYPVTSITTPKYLVPFYMFVGLFVTWFLARIIVARKQLYPLFVVLLSVCVMLACFLPMRPTRFQRPFVIFTTSPWKITDDGPRSFFGYCFALRKLSNYRREAECLIQYAKDPQDVLLIAPFDGWTAYSRSQEYLIFLLKNCANLEINPEGIVGEFNGKKVVLTEPGLLDKNAEKHFSSVGITPSRIAIPLPINREAIEVLRYICSGIVTAGQLAEVTKLDEKTLSGILNLLKHRRFIEHTGLDGYEPTYYFYELQSDLPKLRD